MLPWVWAIVALVIATVVITLSVCLTVTGNGDRDKHVTPVPSVSISPLPSVTSTPSVHRITLFYDKFVGTADTELPSHVPNAPIGSGWATSVYSPYNLELTGVAQAGNLRNINAPSNPAIFSGANISSGKFTSVGYRPETDTLIMKVVFQLPTITPQPEGNEALYLITSLSRTVPQNDLFVVTMYYRIGEDVSVTSPEWRLVFATIFDDNGLHKNEQVVLDTGFVTGAPPIDSDITFHLRIPPNGVCHFSATALGIENITGPTTPDVIPANGFGMNSFWFMANATQDNSTIAQPLIVKFSEVHIESEFII